MCTLSYKQLHSRVYKNTKDVEVSLEKEKISFFSISSLWWFDESASPSRRSYYTFLCFDALPLVRFFSQDNNMSSVFITREKTNIIVLLLSLACKGFCLYQLLAADALIHDLVFSILLSKVIFLWEMVSGFYSWQDLPVQVFSFIKRTTEMTKRDTQIPWLSSKSHFADTLEKKHLHLHKCYVVSTFKDRSECNRKKRAGYASKCTLLFTGGKKRWNLSNFDSQSINRRSYFLLSGGLKYIMYLKRHSLLSVIV